LFNHEDLNLDLLFQENPLANTMATAQNVLDYLKANNNNQILRLEPFFGDGTQDPLTWFSAVTKARQANGWEQTKAMQMLAAYFQDEADDWWTHYVNTNGIDYTHNAYRPGDIETAFKVKFCTQRWQNKWLKDLEGRRQGPSESVDSYYTDFKKLIKRADLEENMSDLQKLRHFLKGLRPEVAPLVAMTAPANVGAALQLAQQYENGQDLINHEQPTRTKPEKTFGFKSKEASHDPMDELVQKFEKMHLKFAEQIENLNSKIERTNKPYFRSNIIPTSGTYTPENGPRVCFKCGKAGHIARFCRSERNSYTQTRYQQPQQSQQVKKDKRINYITVEETSEEEESSDEEEQLVYVGQKERPKPYNTNRKEQKEKVKRSESTKEFNLRSRKNTIQPMEVEDPFIHYQPPP